MTTVLKIGPDDHGRQLSLDDFLAGDYRDGYRYEIIDGRLYVSPLPNLPENQLQEWINDRLKAYARKHPEVINFVSSGARVFVPGQLEVTAPEPDQAAYHDFPVHLPKRAVNWEDVSPVLVVEILSAEDPDRDLIRNVELYRQAPSIREYWVVDGRADADRPTMQVYRRRGQAWQRVIELDFGATYTTKLLPGFKLIIDPRK
jgi:Uma2 family endonuclease